MALLRLKIVTPEQTIFDDEVEEVLVNSSSGQLGILPHHTDLMAELEPGELVIKKGGKDIPMATGDGVIQMTNGNMVIMTDMALEPADIDEKLATEAHARAKLALSQLLSDEEYATTVANLEKSLAQIHVKRRHKTRL